MPVCKLLDSPMAISATTPFSFSFRFCFCSSPYRSFFAGSNFGLCEQFIRGSAASRQAIMGLMPCISFSVVGGMVIQLEILEVEPVLMRVHLVLDGRAVILAD